MYFLKCQINYFIKHQFYFKKKQTTRPMKWWLNKTNYKMKYEHENNKHKWKNDDVNDKDDCFRFWWKPLAFYTPFTYHLDILKWK